MDAEQLKALLQRLHAELEDTSQVDPELRELLGTVDSDIRQILSTDDEGPEPGSVGERVEAAASSFSVKHPRLESVLLEMAEALGRMGI